ncbi:MAG: ArsR/SmtB family transcription factor [Acidimicrobiales bacterium]
MTTNGVEVLRALGHETRQRIVERLVDGPAGVRELSDTLPVTRSAVSQHLKVLRSVGLVDDRPDGTRRLYQLTPQGFEVLRDYLEVVWATALANYRDLSHIDPEHEEKAQP